MRKVIALLLIIIGAVFIWNIGARLSSDAIAMAIGLFFGALAAIPAGLMLIIATRQQNPMMPPETPAQPPQQLAQPPVIVINVPQQIAQPQQQRQFKIVGEPEYPSIEVRQ